MTEGAGLRRYLKEAFLYRWNLLFFGAGALGAVLSGNADVLLPVVAATEMAYLVGLIGIERFRAAIDAKAHAERTSAGTPLQSGAQQPRVEDLIVGLEPHRAERFARLRKRCLDMRYLAQGVGGGAPPGSASRVSGPALDRLLWVFLKLLVSQQALQRFLSATDARQIQQQLDSFKGKLAATAETDERLRRALVDSVATAELRLSNQQKAQSNAQFVDVELDRLEAKIQALAEMSVGHEDPDYISSQVDSVAESMAQTEKAMRELDALTGLSADDNTPAILEPSPRELA
jgi:hypothetical protein